MKSKKIILLLGDIIILYASLIIALTIRYQGFDLEILKTLQDNYVDLIYIDPPFFTQENQYVISTNDYYIQDKNFNSIKYNDKWNDINEYLLFMKQ